MAIAAGTEVVLLAVDEDGVRAIAKYTLEQCGYTVLAACDGAQALERAAQEAGPIDLLVTDVVMPRIGGGALAQELAVLRPGIKTLYLSGYTDDAMVRHGIRAASQVFLQKPFTPAVLARKVRAVLDAKKHPMVTSCEAG